MERPVIYFVTCAKAEMVLFCRFLSANYKLIPRTIKLQCYLLLLHLIIIIPLKANTTSTFKASSFVSRLIESIVIAHHTINIFEKVSY